MTFEEKIAALKSDINSIKIAQATCCDVMERNNEEGEGQAMLSAALVLLASAITYYEEEIAILRGPEAA
jgi:hypothetical protein